MLEVLSFCDRERALLPSINLTVLTFLVKKKKRKMKVSGVFIFREYAKKV